MELSIALVAAGVGMGMWKSSNELSNAKSEAKTIVEAGKIAAENKAKRVMATAAAQKSSFLTSGITLEGTPMAVLSSTYSTGIDDINQIITNSNTRSSNIMSKARSNVLSNLIGGAMTGLSASNALSGASMSNLNPFSGNDVSGGSFLGDNVSGSSIWGDNISGAA